MEFDLKNVFKNKVIIDQVNKKIRLVDTKKNIIDLIHNTPIPTIIHSNRDRIRNKVEEFLKNYKDSEIVSIVFGLQSLFIPEDITNNVTNIKEIYVVEPNSIQIMTNFPYMTGYEMLENFKYNLEAINSGIIKQQNILIEIAAFPSQNHTELILSEVQNEIFSSEI